MDPIVDFLLQQNHRCICIVKINNDVIKWCGQTICPDGILYDKLLQKENRRQTFKQILIDSNHSCIYEQETFPVKIVWCKEEPCRGIVQKSVEEQTWHKLYPS
uniref:Uncharacterized protein n=1 Tax=viral metagenome TaxID=1070528 RepID=A0A6C0C8C0_9ZZZZ